MNKTNQCLEKQQLSIKIIIGKQTKGNVISFFILYFNQKNKVTMALLYLHLENLGFFANKCATKAPRLHQR